MHTRRATKGCGPRVSDRASGLHGLCRPRGHALRQPAEPCLEPGGHQLRQPALGRHLCVLRHDGRRRLRGRLLQARRPQCLHRSHGPAPDLGRCRGGAARQNHAALPVQQGLCPGSQRRVQGLRRLSMPGRCVVRQASELAALGNPGCQLGRGGCSCGCVCFGGERGREWVGGVKVGGAPCLKLPSGRHARAAQPTVAQSPCAVLERVAHPGAWP